MEALLFALPLVGGFIFCGRFNWTRWRAAREDGHRLYFRAVGFGAILFLLVTIARALIEPHCAAIVRMEEWVISAIKPLVAVKEGASAASANAIPQLAITCFLSMAVGAPLAWLMNLFFRRLPWIRRAIKEEPFEAALLDAADRDSLTMATMDDGKVYVGYVVGWFNPEEERKFLTLLPLLSGYRADDTHKVTITTSYSLLYGKDPIEASDAALPGKLGHLRADDFKVWLPIDKLASFRLFDLVAYRAFQNLVPKPAQSSPPTSGSSGAVRQPEGGTDGGISK